jgi:hypothetical protein
MPRLPSDAEPSRREFLESATSFFDKLTVRLHELAEPDSTPQRCRDSVTEALEHLARAQEHLTHAAKHADRSELAEPSDSCPPARIHQHHIE